MIRQLEMVWGNYIQLHFYVISDILGGLKGANVIRSKVTGDKIRSRDHLELPLRAGNAGSQKFGENVCCVGNFLVSEKIWLSFYRNFLVSEKFKSEKKVFDHLIKLGPNVDYTYLR